MSVYLRGTCSQCGNRFFTRSHKCIHCRSSIEGIYWIKFTFEGKRIEESTGLTNKKAAERKEAKRLEELRMRRAGLAPPERQPRFVDHAVAFLAWSHLHHSVSQATLHAINVEAWKRFFAARRLDDIRLDEITRQHVEEFKIVRKNELRQNNSKQDGAPQLTVSGATVNRALTTLKRMYSFQQNDALMRLSPARGVQYFPEVKRQHILTFEEQKRYEKHAGETLRDIETMMTEMGFRPQDLFNLEVSHVDLRNKTLNLWPIAAAGEDAKHGKTEGSRRTVPITKNMLPILKRRCARARALNSRWVFPSNQNPQQHLANIRKLHYKALEAAGIDGPRVRIYDFRHTGLTRLHRAGVPNITLMRIAGHTSLQTTARYVETSDEDKLDAVRKLERYQQRQMS